MKVLPARGLAETSAYVDVPEAQRHTEAVAQERAWLAAMCRPGEQMRFEVRYLSHPQRDQVSCALLGHVYRPTVAAADAAAKALLEQFAHAPRHVETTPLDDVQQALVPFQPQQLVEIRKQLDWAPVPYRSTTRSVYVSVRPLVAQAVSWEQLWYGLARQPGPTLVSVCLEPFEMTAYHQDQLRLLVAEYERASAPKHANPLWGAQSPAVDHAQADALQAHRAALSRYHDRVFRIRISVVSAGVLTGGFTELLAAATGAVVRTPPPGELAAAWTNVTGLDCAWLDQTYRQGAPVLTDVERLLCNLVDVTEATSAFRLPYEITGHLPVFTGRWQPPGPTVPGPHRADPAAPEFD
ncbi:hypothetical protein [Actinocrispum sp. NPDC049592]|uniref:hypothetical protein n=1 Tax=Actinocrispum sp. NPDC049592 TaxID=3154835 RepID=UPI00343BDC89